MKTESQDLEFFKTTVDSAIGVYRSILEDEILLHRLSETVDKVIACFKTGNKLLICGNGGSAADAGHIAAELSGRFNYHRPALNAEALHSNPAELTAIANDYGYQFVFSRQLEARGKKGDILLAISTSGQSDNILRALKKANELGMQSVLFTGNSEKIHPPRADLILEVPSGTTARIQEGHLLLGHMLCELVEQKMFPKSNQ